eukprot:5482645-Pyramimonas_sp.AAC.1
MGAWLAKLGACVEGSDKLRAKVEGKGSACAAEESVKWLLEARERAAAHFGNQKAFREESGGDAGMREARRRMADYSDQFFTDDQFTMN